MRSGRKFFKMDFLDAERTIGGARNRTLIVELMPHYPVYVPLLPGPRRRRWARSIRAASWPSTC